MRRNETPAERKRRRQLHQQAKQALADYQRSAFYKDAMKDYTNSRNPRVREALARVHELGRIEEDLRDEPTHEALMGALDREGTEQLARNLTEEPPVVEHGFGVQRRRQG
jgi:hypothetical protein